MAGVLVALGGGGAGRQAAPRPGLLHRAYTAFLYASLRFRWALFVLFIAAFYLAVERARSLPTELFPPGVHGRLSLELALPSGATLDRTEEAVARLEAAILPLRYREPALAPLLGEYEHATLAGDLPRFLPRMETLLLQMGREGEAAPLAKTLYAELIPSDWRGRIKQAVDDKRREEEVNRQLARIRERLDKMIVLESVTSVIGAGGSTQGGNPAHTARMDVVVRPGAERELGSDALIARLRRAGEALPDLSLTFQARDDFIQEALGKARGDLVLEVHAEALDQLSEIALSTAERLRGLPGMVNVRTSLVHGEDQYVLTPDVDALLRGRFKLASLARQVSDQLQSARSDAVKLDAGEMEVVVENPRSERADMRQLLALTVVSEDGMGEKLGNLVEVARRPGFSEIMRVNQERTLLVLADLAGARYSDAVASVEHALARAPWPRGASWNFAGEEVARRESFQRLGFALIVATVLVYMVIAAILESLVHPLTIMLSAPFALIGVVVAFVATGLSLNLLGYIGIVMLVGIVVNNAIVLLDRIHQLRQQLPLRDAVVRATGQRLRPILMTSLTTILALAPLALGYGAGAELRRPLAIAVIGGLTASTFLTLWIMPALYLCVEDLLALLRAPFRRSEP